MCLPTICWGVQNVCIEDLEKELVGQYTVANFMNTVLELSPARRQDVANYINLLKAAEGEGKK